MTTYYKAARPDGTDFRTGTLLHYVGAAIEHPALGRPSYPWSPRRINPNDPSTYLSTSVEPAETLIGGRWPCRLFEVEPIGEVVARTDGSYPHKRGMQAYSVIRELPAHMALGPNGEAVAAIIERADRLTTRDIDVLGRHVTWEDDRLIRAAWVIAHNAMYSAAREAAAFAALMAMRQVVVSHARLQYSIVADTMVVVRRATTALIARDLISAEHFDTLYGPWASVIDNKEG